MTGKKQPTEILVNLGKMLPELEALYRDIHAHPELSMHETRTAEIAANRLKANGFEVTTGVGKTGVVGILRNGDGPTVMLRADMDALPITEATGLPMRVQLWQQGLMVRRCQWRIRAGTICTWPA